MDTPGTSKSPRAASIADFCDYLRTTNNRNGRPYEEATVENYVFAARALDRWKIAEGIDGDFTVADTAMLNRFLRIYFRQHDQGGTHSQQRNMRHLFSYLAREAGHPHPYTDALHRYSEQKQRLLRPCPRTSSRTCSRSPATAGLATSGAHATMR